MTVRPRRRPPGRRFELAGFPIGDVAAVLGLVVIGALSLTLLSGNLPLPGGGGGDNGGGGGGGGPARTATPSNVVNVDPRGSVPGSIVYAKTGNIWVQHGAKSVELTTGGHDSMPSFSPDGQWIYFVRTVDESGSWRIGGQARRYRLQTPTLMRIHPDGSAAPESLLTGRIKSGSYLWAYFIRQPVASPDGQSVVVVTDGPDPTSSDVVLKSFSLSSHKLTSLNAPESPPLGHQDPAWGPDGRYLLFVKNARNGANGAPQIDRYDTTTKKTSAITGSGYTSPAWSPDGRFIAATRTTAFGTDVVVLDALRGTELLRVTNDEHSFDPIWSPAGDAIAYLSISGGVTDLWRVKIDATGLPTLKGTPLQLTIAAGLDAASRPSWWIPADQLPTPAPTPTTAPTPLPTAGPTIGASSAP
jgi:Tol biopolymer transport system component